MSIGAPFRTFDATADYYTFVDGKARYDGVQSFLKSRAIEIPHGSPSDSPGDETVCGLGNRKDGLFRRELLMRTAKNEGSLAGRFDFVLDIR